MYCHYTQNFITLSSCHIIKGWTNTLSKSHPKIPVSHARQFFHQWWFARRPHNIQPTTRAIIQEWEKPSSDFLKLNIDAALFTDQHSFGLGLCIRDHSGGFVRARSFLLQGNPDPREAEVLGLLYALLWVVLAQSMLNLTFYFILFFTCYFYLRLGWLRFSSVYVSCLMLIGKVNLLNFNCEESGTIFDQFHEKLFHALRMFLQLDLFRNFQLGS